MAYYGNAPADVALVVGQDVITTTEIQDATIATADIASDAITATKIDDDGTGFQMGSLGLGTAVSGSHKLTVGGTATFSGDITGTLATASQGNITSVGTLTGLTTSGHILIDADDKALVLGADQDASIWATDVGNVYIGSGQDYSLSSSDTEGWFNFKVGTSGESFLNIVGGEGGVSSLYMTADQADDNADRWRLQSKTNGHFTISTLSSGSYVEALTVEGDGTVQTVGALQPSGNVSVGGYAKTSNYFETAGGSGGQQAYSSSVTSSYRGGGLIRFFTDNNVSIFKLGNEASPYGGYFGTFAGYSPSGAELMILGIDGVNIGKNRNSEVIGLRCSTGGTLQSGAGAINATNADNWNLVVKSTTGGTIASGGGMGYFALGDNYTTSDAILQVRNDGNRGSKGHASGSSLFKASFNDATAFEIKKSGQVQVPGEYELIETIRLADNSSDFIRSVNCFSNDYTMFKIVIGHIGVETEGADIWIRFLLDGDGSQASNSEYNGNTHIVTSSSTTITNVAEAGNSTHTIFHNAWDDLAGGVHGELKIFNVTTPTISGSNTDRGDVYRPYGYGTLVGYNTSESYSRQDSHFRYNTNLNPDRYTGFRINASTGNFSANSYIQILGRRAS